MQMLTPVLKDYAWGTRTDIPELLGLRPSGEPVAEAWWGSHGDGPSPAADAHGEEPLDARIAADPELVLGAEAVDRWGTRLPFLLKVLAIDKPLSIQVHPTSEQARAGFARAQRATAGAATFRDPHHKPEMIVALTPMTVLVGVRRVEELRRDLLTLDTETATHLAHTLDTGDLSAFIPAALASGTDTLDALAREGERAPAGSSLGTAAHALRHFPGDAGAIVALALNAMRVEPGHALYVGAGVLHSYQSGMGVEIMANSDNVVRAGLTSKHIDVPLLLELADTRPGVPARPDVHTRGAARTFATVAEEFALTLIEAGDATAASGPRIVLGLGAETTVSAGGERVTLERGDAVFVPHGRGAATVATAGRAVIAHLPGAV